MRPKGQCQSLRGNWWCTLLRCKTDFFNILILSIHPYIHINLNMYIYIYIFVYLYIYIHIYIYLLIYTHTQKTCFIRISLDVTINLVFAFVPKKWVKLCQRRFVFTNFGLLIVGTCGGY